MHVHVQRMTASCALIHTPFFYCTSVCGFAGNSGKDSILCRLEGCFPFAFSPLHVCCHSFCLFLVFVRDFYFMLHELRSNVKFAFFIENFVCDHWSNIVRLFSSPFSFNKKNTPKGYITKANTFQSLIWSNYTFFCF